MLPIRDADPLNPSNIINGQWNQSNYRFGYNGMEKDDDGLKGNGNSYTTEFRQYDPRLGRWLSLDPLMMQFPWMSPYVAFNNNPILLTDPLGLASEGGPEGEDPNPDAGSEHADRGCVDGDPPSKAGSVEGQSAKTEYLPMAKEASWVTENWNWHSGGVNGSKAGWMSSNDYFNKIIKPAVKDFDKFMDGGDISVVSSKS